MAKGRKKRAQIQTLWTSPANPDLDLGLRSGDEKIPKNTEANDEAREAELKRPLQNSFPTQGHERGKMMV